MFQSQGTVVKPHLNNYHYILPMWRQYTHRTLQTQAGQYHHKQGNTTCNSTNLVRLDLGLLLVEALQSCERVLMPVAICPFIHSFTQTLREMLHRALSYGPGSHLHITFRAESFTNPSFPLMYAGVGLNSRRPEVSSIKKSSAKLVSVWKSKNHYFHLNVFRLP